MKAERRFCTTPVVVNRRVKSRTPVPVRCGGCDCVISYAFREHPANAALEYCPTCTVSLLAVERALLLREIPDPEVTKLAARESTDWAQFVEHYAGKKET